MNHTDVVKGLAKKLGTTQKVARQQLNSRLREIESDLTKNGCAELAGLGQFEVIESGKRRCYIPGIDGYFIVPTRYRLRLQLEKSLKRQLRKTGINSTWTPRESSN